MRRSVLVLSLLLVFGPITPALGETAGLHQHPGIGETGPAPSAVDTTTASAPNNTVATVTYTVHPRREDPSRVLVTANYSIGDLERFSPTLIEHRGHEAEVLETDGFTPRHEDHHVRLVWDGRTTSPTVTYELIRPPAFRRGGEYAGRIAQFVDGGEWLIVRKKQPVAYHERLDWRIDETTVVDTAEPTVRGDGTIFVGEHDVYERRTPTQTFRLVVPASGNPASSPDAMFDALANVSRAMPGEPPREEHYVVVSAGEREVDEAVDDVFVHESRSLADTEGILIHEYVHTRQRYGVLGDRIRWFDEGSAEYLATLFTAYQGRADSRAFRTALVAEEYPDALNATLSSPENEGTAVEYEKGTRVVAALDAKIRRSTGGERTILDVIARMNRHDGRVTYGDFKDLTAAVAGERFDRWLDRYATTSAVPPVPEDTDVFANPRPGADSDGDGVADRREVERGTDPFRASGSLAALAASLGVSVVGVVLALLAMRRYA